MDCISEGDDGGVLGFETKEQWYLGKPEEGWIQKVSKERRQGQTAWDRDYIKRFT